MEIGISQAQMKTIMNSGKIPSDVQKMAEQYESVFLQTSFQAMFGELMNGMGASTGETGAGSGAWQSMLVEEYANAVADAGGIGLSDAITRDLMKFQEVGR